MEKEPKKSAVESTSRQAETSDREPEAGSSPCESPEPHPGILREIGKEAREQGDGDVQRHKQAERRGDQACEHAPGIHVREHPLDERQDRAHPHEAQKPPHHAEREVRAAVDAAERAGIVPGDGAPQHLHEPARRVLHHRAQQHGYEEDDEVVRVVEAVERHREHHRTHAVYGRERAPHEAGAAFVAAVHDGVEHRLH